MKAISDLYIDLTQNILSCKYQTPVRERKGSEI